MKKFPLIAALFAMGMGMALNSCGDKAATAPAAGAEGDSLATEDVLRETALAKYVRYVDMVRIQSEYTLFREYAAADSAASYSMAVQQNQHASRLQKRAEEIQNKYQQGLYLSQASLDSDQAQLQKMQESAAAEMEKRQIEYARQLGNMQKQINDSIDNVVRYICTKHHYDAILNSAAGLYFNPALDITDEVLSELNLRYKPESAK